MIRSWLLVALSLVSCLSVGCKDREAKQQVRIVAVVTLQTHPILDAVQDGLLKQLAAEHYEEGPNVHYLLRNANGDIQRVASIANEIAAANPNVTVAISTPVAQAVVRSARNAVVFGALTDPVGAGILKSLDEAQPNVTGTTDALPYEEQLKLIRPRFGPSIKRIGLLFNPGEAASQYAIKELRRLAPTLGFELVEGAANSTNEVYPVAQSLGDRVDALLISTDNTVAAGIAGAVRVAIEKKRPLFACDSGSVEKGAIAAVSPGYHDIGTETGKLVARVLRGERNIRVVVPRGGEIYLNRKAAGLMGLALSESILKEATKTFDDIK